MAAVSKAMLKSRVQNASHENLRTTIRIGAKQSASGFSAQREERVAADPVRFSLG
jgi:hypothetical protein